MAVKKYFTIIFFLCLCVLVKAQSNVLVYFPEKKNIVITGDVKSIYRQGHSDSIQYLGYELFHDFYAKLTARLEKEYFRVINAGDDAANGRYCVMGNWYFLDSTTNAQNRKKTYTATNINHANTDYFKLKMQAEEADYSIFINKISIRTSLFRKIFFADKYIAQVDFDIYDKDMKKLNGRYISKKLRFNSETYWAAFSKIYSILPEELALYFNTLVKR